MTENQPTLQLTFNPRYTVPADLKPHEHSDLKPHEHRWAVVAADGPVYYDGDWSWVNIKLIGWVRG